MSAASPLTYGCAVCGGTGWVDTYERVTWENPEHKTYETISRQEYLDERKIEKPFGQGIVQPAARKCRLCNGR